MKVPACLPINGSRRGVYVAHLRSGYMLIDIYSGCRSMIARSQSRPAVGLGRRLGSRSAAGTLGSCTHKWTRAMRTAEVTAAAAVVVDTGRRS